MSLQSTFLVLALTHTGAVAELCISVQLSCTLPFMSSRDFLLLEEEIRENQLDKGATAQYSRCQVWNIISLVNMMKKDISPNNVKVQSRTLSLIVAADFLCFKIIKNLITLRGQRSHRKQRKTIKALWKSEVLLGLNLSNILSSLSFTGPLKLCKKENPTLQGKDRGNCAILHFFLVYVACPYISKSIKQFVWADINLFCELSIKLSLNQFFSFYLAHP